MTSHRSSRALGAISGCALLLGIAVACSTHSNATSTVRRGDGGSDSTTGGTTSTGGDSSTGGSNLCVGDTCHPQPEAGPSPPGCGDGVLTKDEACDDGNTVSDDGCSSDCLMVELGFSCPTAGMACTHVAKCGDGVATPPEFCDDGGDAAGDGCSAFCTLEPGYKCSGTPSVCTKTTCGDGVKEGTESCDDGNTDPYDGCSTTCQTEPNCKAGACASDCGDGLIIDEECDDGNTRNGDGCSDKCKKEPGFNCTVDTTVPDVLNVPIIYRDFRDHADTYHGHPNFHWSGLATATTKIVKVDLDKDGKPEFGGGGDWQIGSQANFSTWYRPSDYSLKFAETLPLTNTAGVYTYDSTAFFPLDKRGWAVDPTHPETLFAGDSGLHNFLFTSEVHYWFKYDAAKGATLSFRGDDDVWVFIAGKLSVDLGGVHDAVSGTITVNGSAVDTSGAALNLVQDKVYEIDVFQAERNPGGSNYKLQLSGFNSNPSVCMPVCGDGILTIGEQCDDGVNAGGYGKCGPGCVLTEYCGDGIVQPEEDCDDGNRVDTDDCNNACRQLVVH